MKKIIIILLLLLATIAKSQSNSEALKDPFGNDFWSNPSNRLHFFASYGISATTYLILTYNSDFKNLSPFKKRVLILTTTIAIGLLKEALDATEKNNYFDKQDMVANYSGAAAFQASVTIPLNFRKKKELRLTKR